MGILTQKYIPFTSTHVKNRDLIILMLKYEDSIYFGDIGKQLYANKFYLPRTSLNPEYTIIRMVLQQFGFNTDDESIENYLSIFKNYYQSPTSYDKEVLDSVVYMRENKCVYYTAPDINVGDKLPNCSICQLDGQTKISVHDILKMHDFEYAFIGAFSTS